MRRNNPNPKKPSTADIRNRFKAVAEKTARDAKFDGRVSVGETKSPRLSARTNMQTREIEERYADSYAEQYPSRMHALAESFTLHEINHHRHNGVVDGYTFKGCPRNVELATKLVFEPMSDVLFPKKFSRADAEYLENALEDTLLHSDLSPAFDLKGISYFFQEVGQGCPKKVFTPLYEAHIKLNLMFWGNNNHLRGLKQHFSKDKETTKKIDDVILQFINESGLKDLGASFDYAKSPDVVKERLKLRNYVTDEKNWPKISKAYAEAFSKLMTPNYAMSLPNHSGAGTKGRESEKSEGEGNEFQKGRQEREYKRGRIEEAHKSGQGAPSWIDSFEARDLLYEGLAKRLAFDVKTFTESTSMPIFSYGERRFNPRTDTMSNITFGFNRDAEIEIRKRPYTIDMQIPIKQSTLGFPKARLVLLDTSGSMKYDFNNGENVGSTKLVPWGDKSKYHGALVEWYGLLQWLRENHILERTGIDLINFSDKTLIGKGLESAKRLALNPQFGNTYLDESKINEMFSGKNMFITSISDGAIGNWSSVKEKFLKGVSENYYVHLQIGAENQMCQDIRAAGGHVEVIRTADELKGRTIRLADKFYRGRGK